MAADLNGASVYQFDINVDDDKWEPLVVGTGGPGLHWSYAVNEAVRLHGRRRGDVGWRSMHGVVQGELSMAEAGWRALAHVRVATSRHNELHCDLLDVWVRRVSDEDLVDDDGVARNR